MALQKGRDRISVRGGGLFKIRELKPTATDAWSDVGYLTQTGFEDTRNMMEISDERGFQIDYLAGSETPVIRCLCKQTSIDEINLVKNADGKYYEGYYYVKLANGRIQEFDIALCKIKPGPVLQFAAATERTIELEIHMLAVNATGTVNRTPAGFNLDTTVNMYYVVVENAAAINAPSDTAATYVAGIF